MPVKKLPLSGGEVPFRLYPWNTVRGKWANNCYAYAMNDWESFRIHKSIPGDISGLSNLHHTYTHCKDLKRRVVSDNPKKVYACKPTAKCRRGHYKVFLFVAPKNKYGNSTGDFHWYKQHGLVNYKVKSGDTMTSIARFFKVPVSRVKKALKDKPLTPGKEIRFEANGFSHKRGWGGDPLLTDASGKAIIDPRKSNRKYGYNYSKLCNCFCVKNRGVNVGKTKVSKK